MYVKQTFAVEYFVIFNVFSVLAKFNILRRLESTSSHYEHMFCVVVAQRTLLEKPGSRVSKHLVLSCL